MGPLQADLASLPLFADAAELPLARLSEALTVQAHEPGDVLMRQGDRGTSFAIVLDGDVAVSRVDDLGVHDLGVHDFGKAGPGSILGELAMLTGHPRQATVAAATPVRLAVGDHAAFELLLDVPDVQARLATIAARRLAEVAMPVPVSLRDGTQLLLGPLLASDRDKIDAGLARESPESLRRRFFSPARPSGRTLDYLVNINYIDHFAWGVTTAERREGVATARYVRGGDEPETAEVAFYVAEGYRDRGVATLLLGALAAAASSAGITHFTANVLYENAEMRAVFDKARARWHHAEPGVTSASFEVSAACRLIDDSLRSQLVRTARDVVTAAGLTVVHHPSS
jgi:CRP-like cAMP-binding protein